MRVPQRLRRDTDAAATSGSAADETAVSAPHARLLPATRSGGPMPWVIAILIGLVVVAAAGGLALGNLADNARADLSGAATIQIVEADPELRDDLARRAAETIGQQRYVTSVRIVPQAELAQLLEPWLGANAGDGAVPIPALIDVELRGPADERRIEALRSTIAEALGDSAPAARVDAQSQWLEPVYDALAALQYLALALIALVATATAAAVWLASRSAFANHRETVEIIHLLGGTDAQVIRVFQKAVLRDAAIGAIFGLLIGVGAVWVLALQFGSLDGGMVSHGGLGIADWLAIAAIPVGAIVLALITARITIGFALRSLL